MAPSAVLATIAVAISTALIAITQAKINENLVVEFSKKSGSSIFQKDHSSFCVLIESKESDDFDDFYDEFLKAAQKFEKTVKFVYINTDLEENWQVIEYLGLIAEDVPTVLFINLEKGMIKHKAEFDEMTKENIIKFTEDCLSGKIEPYIKGDDAPEGWNKKVVNELVSKTFQEAVFNVKHSTFVFFYSTTCPACQNMMPEVEKLGERFKDSSEVVIARMNAVNNEVPGIPVVDVPTIALFVRGSTKPIYHVDDERTAEHFAQFIKKHLKMEEEEKKEAHDGEEETKDEVKPKQKKQQKKKSEKAKKSDGKSKSKKSKSKNEKKVEL